MINTSTDVNLQKAVSCRVTNSVLKYLESRGYDADSITAGLPYSKEYLADPLNWVTYEARETICRRAAKLTNDDTIMYHVGLSTPKLNPLGGIESMVRMLAGPKTVYRSITKYASLLDRIFRFSTTFDGNNRATVTMCMNSDYSPSKDSCYYAQGILAAIPTLWGLPPAEIREKKCMCQPDYTYAKDGVQYEAEACVFEVRWQLPQTWHQNLRDNLFRRGSHMTTSVRDIERNFQLLDQKNAELVKRNKELAAVREIAIGVDNVRTIDEALTLAVERARDIEGIRFVLVQKLDETGEFVITPYYSKFRNQYALNAIKALGFDPSKELGENPTSRKLRFSFSKLKAAQDYRRNPRVMVMTSLAELLDGVWPGTLCDAIQKILGVKKLIIVPLMVEGKSWGNMLYFLTKEVPIDILEMIGAHCAIAIKNIIFIEALAKSEDKFSKAFNSSPNIMAVTTLKDGKYIEINEGFTSGTGYTRDEIIGRTTHEINTWANYEDRTKMLKLIREQGRIHNEEFQFLVKSGEVHTMLFSAEQIKVGNEPCLIAACTDITARKRLEESIRYHAGLVDAVSDAIVSSDKEYKIISWNRAAEQLYGWREEEVIGKDILDLLKPDYLNVTIPEIQASMDEKGYWKGESIQQRKDGTKLYVIDSVSMRRDAQGNNIGAVTVFKDITERKQMEKALQESEEKFSKAFRASPEQIYITRAEDGKTVEINESYTRLTGYTREETIGRTSTELGVWTKPEDRQRMLKILKENGRVRNEEFEFRIKSGEIRTQLFSCEPITLNGEECIITLITDITERKLMEKALKESEEKFSKAFHASPEAISISRVSDGTFLEINDSYTLVSGYTREELIGKSADSLTMWVNAEQRERMSRNIQERVRMRNEEFKFRTKSGELRTKLISSEFIYLSGELCLLVVSTDITERKKVEEALFESREKFSVAFRSSPNAICIVTIQGGKFIEVNESFVRFTGYTREDIIGHNSDELGFWLNEDEMKRMAKNLQENGRIYNEEYASRRKSGEIRVGLFSAETIDIGGEPCLIMVITDITDRRYAEKALKESEENIRSQKELIERVLSTIPNAVVLLDRGLRVIMANQGAYNVLKLDKLELLGKALEIRDLDQTIANMINRGENSARVEIRHTIAGRERILSTDVFAMLKDELLLVISDITDEREKQERLYLTDRLASVGEMSSGVAHELNNPLTSIIGLSNLLLKQGIPDDIKEDLTAIHSEAQRCAAIVKNLLTFGRKHVSKRQPLNVASVVQDVMRLRAYEHKANNISVEILFPPALPEVLADYFQMQQVFLNIILNAETAMIDAHGRGTLKITGESVNDFVRISFSDDGPGISRENMRSIFNPFFTTKEVGKGTGLGLSICYGIVTAHGGRIFARSENGKGATFVVELPVFHHQRG